MPGEIPSHQKLESIIDTSPKICTSLLLDKYLQGKYKAWAVVAAFGDNMLASASEAAAVLSLNSKEVNQLKRLGISINYNGYGSSVSDLHFPPDRLYQLLVKYQSPLDFINDPLSVYQHLQIGYDSALAMTQNLTPEIADENIAVYQLPDKAWARRVSGVFGNQLSNQYPDRAHAILSHHPDEGYVVSVRAPQRKLDHAGELCSKFSTGGGRKGAAGINQLIETEVDKFIRLFKKTYQ
jgi:hypothetical protein